MVSIKRPGLNFPQKVFIKRPGLIQVLRALVHENQGNLDYLKNVSIKVKLKGIHGKIDSIAYF